MTNKQVFSDGNKGSKKAQLARDLSSEPLQNACLTQEA